MIMKVIPKYYKFCNLPPNSQNPKVETLFHVSTVPHALSIERIIVSGALDDKFPGINPTK